MSLDENSPPEKGGSLGVVAAACILTLGLGTSLYFMAQALETGLMRPDRARAIVTQGHAERRVKPDAAIWPLRIVATGSDLAPLYAKMETDLRSVQDFLKAHGIPDDDMQVGPLVSVDLLAHQTRLDFVRDNRFLVYGNVVVRSSHVDALRDASLKIGDLARAGVFLTDQGPGGAAALAPLYTLPKLDEIRAELAVEALQAARLEAETLARRSGVEVRGLDRVEDIVDPVLKTDNDMYSESKKISLTVRAEYSIK